MPTNWSEKSVAVLHSLFFFTPSMRPPWQQLVFASWDDASDRLRPDGSRTGGYVITPATEELFGHGQEDDVSVMSWRSFKLPTKINGSNNGEPQALAFADESLWLVRLAWSEMHSVPTRRWHLDETVRQLGGMLITYSRCFFFFFDAFTRSESPQLRLRSSRTGEKHVVSRNSVPSPMLAFTGSILQRCWQTV